MTETTLARVSPLQLQPQVAALLDQPTVENVRKLLQVAIQLEHSTIPPYLYALYSLGTSGNQDAADIIQSVVVQEMLHLNLAANVLNAIGGSPIIASESFIPKYPGPLPGLVENQLIVHLAPCSIDVLRDTFLVIEQPEDPLNFPMEAMAGATPLTIGQFYQGTSDAIGQLGDKAFTGNPDRQVTKGIGGAIAVTDVGSAQRAIAIIVEQGEGTSISPEESDGGAFAHYYRFAEIVKGRRLVPNPDWQPPEPPDQKYHYAGAPIPFDPATVFAIPTDPEDVNYPPSTLARRVIDTFNYNYTGLLETLHVGFNGDPGVIGGAVGAMFSLRQQAIEMMSGHSTNGVAVGPTFEWRPALPEPGEA
jgi:hypothetical protein